MYKNFEELLRDYEFELLEVEMDFATKKFYYKANLTRKFDGDKQLFVYECSDLEEFKNRIIEFVNSRLETKKYKNKNRKKAIKAFKFLKERYGFEIDQDEITPYYYTKPEEKYNTFFIDFRVAKADKNTDELLKVLEYN